MSESCSYRSGHNVNPMSMGNVEYNILALSISRNGNNIANKTTHTPHSPPELSHPSTLVFVSSTRIRRSAKI